LVIASGVEGIDDELQMWFRRELATLERITGGGVFECAKLASMQSSENERQLLNSAAIPSVLV
jgi:hypothetical protein